MRLTDAQARDLLSRARVARLATAGDDRRPHLVPVTFAIDGDPVHGDLAYIAIDHKPKTTMNLRRLRNIGENPLVALLADHYEEDWDRLWWARLDGEAGVIDSDPAVTDASATRQRDRALDALAAKYGQYRQVRPAGPVIVIRVTRWTGWTASGGVE